MGAADLLATLKSNVAEFRATEKLITENNQLAQENREEIKTLRLESQSLESQAGAYDDRVLRHNRQAQSYNERCIGEKLPGDVYEQCLELKTNLDTQKAELDTDGAALQENYDAYNARVTALSESESTRAEAASQLLDRYKALDQAIRSIISRLYDLAVERNQGGFSERVRQCTLEDDLDDLYACMEAAWSGS